MRHECKYFFRAIGKLLLRESRFLNKKTISEIELFLKELDDNNAIIYTLEEYEQMLLEE